MISNDFKFKLLVKLGFLIYPQYSFQVATAQLA